MTHQLFRIVNERKSNQFLIKNERVKIEQLTRAEIAFLNEVVIAITKKGIFEYIQKVAEINQRKRFESGRLVSKSIFSRIGNVKKSISVLMLGIQFTHCPTKYTVTYLKHHKSFSKGFYENDSFKQIWKNSKLTLIEAPSCQRIKRLLFRMASLFFFE